MQLINWPVSHKSNGTANGSRVLFGYICNAVSTFSVLRVCQFFWEGTCNMVLMDPTLLFEKQVGVVGKDALCIHTHTQYLYSTFVDKGLISNVILL